jgi:hypothetical protein
MKCSAMHCTRETDPPNSNGKVFKLCSICRAHERERYHARMNGVPYTNSYVDIGDPFTPDFVSDPALLPKRPPGK